MCQSPRVFAFIHSFDSPLRYRRVSVAMQIVSTKNIKKITASMKMVSAAKLKGDEARLKVSRPFNDWTAQLTGPVMDVEDAIPYPQRYYQ